MKRPVPGPSAAPAIPGDGPGPGGGALREWAALLLPLVPAVFLSAAYLAVYIQRIPFYASPVVDAGIYDRWARTIASGDWLSRGEGVFYRAPLYPYLLAVVDRAFGAPAPWVQLLQTVLGIAVILLAGLLARRIGGRVAGVAAMLLLAFYGPLMATQSKLLPTIAGLFLHLCALLLVLRFAQRPSRRGGLFAGLVLGLGALVRPQWLLLGILLPLALPAGTGRARPVRERRSRRWRNAFLCWIPFWVGIGIVVAPVTLRNRILGNDWVVVSSNGGMTFYQGNNEENHSGLLTIVKKFELFGSATQQRRLETRVAERETGRSLLPSQTSAFWTRQAIGFITGSPLSWLVLEARKLYRVTTSFEYADNYSYYIERDRLWPLRIAVVPSGLILALGVLGALLSGGADPAKRAVGISAGMGIAGCLAFYVSSRYRMDAIPALAILGGFAVSQVGQRPWRRRGARWGIALALVIFMASFLPAGAPARSQESITYLQLGNALEAQKRFREAEQAYRRSVEDQPVNTYSWNSLVLLVSRLDGAPAADSLLTEAPEVVREHPLSLYTRGYLQGRLGREEEAEASFEAALRGNPLMKEAHFNLALLEEKRRVYPRAASELEEALALGQDDADLLAHLTYVRIQLRRYAQARESALALLRLRPGDPDATLNLAVACFYLGDLAEARTRLEQAGAIASRPGEGGHADPLIVYYGGLLGLREGRLADAAADLEGLVAADSTDHRALYYLTLCRSAGAGLDRNWPGWRGAWERAFGQEIGPTLPMLAAWLQERAKAPWGGDPSQAERADLERIGSSPGGEQVASEILRFCSEESLGNEP